MKLPEPVTDTELLGLMATTNAGSVVKAAVLAALTAAVLAPLLIMVFCVPPVMVESSASAEVLRFVPAFAVTDPLITHGEVDCVTAVVAGKLPTLTLSVVFNNVHVLPKDPVTVNGLVSLESMLVRLALPEICNALVEAPDGNGSDAAETGTAEALSCVSVKGPMTDKGDVNFESMEVNDALPDV